MRALRHVTSWLLAGMLPLAGVRAAWGANIPLCVPCHENLPGVRTVALTAAAGDLNADGFPDLIVGTQGTFSEAAGVQQGAQDLLFLNDQTGRFRNETARRLPAAQDVTRAIVLADVDGDQDLDIVKVAYRYEQRERLWGGLVYVTPVSVSENRVLINDGLGVFGDETAKRLPPLTGFTLDAAAGDLDSDNDLDLVLGNHILVNDGTGFFETFGSIRAAAGDFFVRKVVLGDFDGDGDLDLFYLLYDRALIFKNDGLGRFSFDETERPDMFETTLLDARAGDVDRDGDLDLVLLTAGFSLELFFNDGKGRFKVAPSSGELSSRSGIITRFVMEDFNLDGGLDVMTLNRSSVEPFSIFRNDGTGQFRSLARGVDHGTPFATLEGGLLARGESYNTLPGVFPTNLVSLDADRDGDTEVFVTTLYNAGFTAQAAPDLLFCSTLNPRVAIRIDSPPDEAILTRKLVAGDLGASLMSRQVTVSGRLFGTPREVTVNGVPAQVLRSNRFQITLPLQEGRNLLKAVAVAEEGGAAGHYTTVTLRMGAVGVSAPYLEQPLHGLPLAVRAVPSEGFSPLFVQLETNETPEQAKRRIYHWSFGDNTSTLEAKPSHTFTYSQAYDPQGDGLEASLYRVFLAAEDKLDGSVMEAETFVVVKPRAPQGGAAFFAELEAEKGVLAGPMEVGEDPAASGGEFVWQPYLRGEARRGEVAVTFNVTRPGTYALWVRSQAPSFRENSFFVTIDDRDTFIWDVPVSEAWTWSRVEWGYLKTFHFSEGERTVRFQRREYDTRIDALLATSDVLYDPAQEEARRASGESV